MLGPLTPGASITWLFRVMFRLSVIIKNQSVVCNQSANWFGIS